MLGVGVGATRRGQYSYLKFCYVIIIIRGLLSSYWSFGGTFGRFYLARVRDGSGGALFAVKKVVNDEMLLAISYLATTNDA